MRVKLLRHISWTQKFPDCPGIPVSVVMLSSQEAMSTHDGEQLYIYIKSCCGKPLMTIIASGSIAAVPTTFLNGWREMCYPTTTIAATTTTTTTTQDYDSNNTNSNSNDSITKVTLQIRSQSVPQWYLTCINTFLRIMIMIIAII